MKQSIEKYHSPCQLLAKPSFLTNSHADEMPLQMLDCRVRSPKPNHSEVEQIWGTGYRYLGRSEARDKVPQESFDWIDSRYKKVGKRSLKFPVVVLSLRIDMIPPEL